MWKLRKKEISLTVNWRNNLTQAVIRTSPLPCQWSHQAPPCWGSKRKNKKQNSKKNLPVKALGVDGPVHPVGDDAGPFLPGGTTEAHSCQKRQKKEQQHYDPNSANALWLVWTKITKLLNSDSYSIKHWISISAFKVSEQESTEVKPYGNNFRPKAL